MLKYKIDLLISIILIQALISCAIDVRQIPPIRLSMKDSLIQERESLFIRKLDIYLADRDIFIDAWQVSFKNSLKNNHSYLDVMDASNYGIPSKDIYILDIEIYPRIDDNFNWLVGWPAVYPFVGWWPLQIRKGDYEIEIKYFLYKNNIVVNQKNMVEYGSKSIIFYGFFRTREIEKMIELTNLRIFDQCAKSIANTIQ